MYDSTGMMFAGTRSRATLSEGAHTVVKARDAQRRDRHNGACRGAASGGGSTQCFWGTCSTVCPDLAGRQVPVTIMNQDVSLSRTLRVTRTHTL